jgi:hypothetical protein
MFKSSLFVSVALSLASLASVASLAACGSAPPGESTGRSGQAATVGTQATPDPQFTPCASDVDCVAIPMAGCCHNGWLVSVNGCSVDAYEQANVCDVTNPICPMYIVNDTRVPVCDPSTNACTLVQPASTSADDAGAPVTVTGDDAGTGTTQF